MINKILLITLLFSGELLFANSQQLPIKIENNIKGAPITLGIPFPKGELFDVDNIRLLTAKGKEIVCQTTEVSTWEPVDTSIKWIWIFFFSEETSNYIIEYGKEIIPIRSESGIVSTNNMRPHGGITVNTGALSFKLNKKGNGFLDEVFIDENEDGQFTPNEQIASSRKEKRGTFLDILDDNGIDKSRTVINNVFREKGSGPLHVIFRVEGTYLYNRDDNNISPFTIRIHAYLNKSYIKVLHTLTYTGIPDKHKTQKGDHSNIATQNKNIVSENTENDPGWTQANDQISSCGLSFKYHLDKEILFTSSINKIRNKNELAESIYKYPKAISKKIELQQTGPKYKGNISSSLTKSSNGFSAKILQNKEILSESQTANGWIDISDAKRGISVGIKNFFQEYPKGLEIDPKTNSINGYIWPPSVDPMSFERKHTRLDGEMLDNFAQGITKTTEFIYYFHKKENTQEIKNTMDYVINEPIAHAEPKWYTVSKVYGNMAPFSSKHPEYENALQYKYDWWAYNQKEEGWYSMFDYGDGKAYYTNGVWEEWGNNEPTVDFMLWTNFMRTGNTKYYKLAQAMSKHTMDVDNVHWPKKRKYVGGVNDAIDFWNFEEEPESTPYLGIGRRHAEEHWYALLSAHVWIQGWITSYNLTGDHRALEIAKMTGDTYIKRIWGEHDLRGRRLYLSILNLVELYDATKSDKYKKELDDRIDLLLQFQNDQGGNLLLDRYGYSQTYIAQGLYKYQQITDNNKIRNALLKHARWVRDVPPYNHQMESYLATIYPLVIGYEFSQNKSFLKEAVKRAEFLKMSKLPKPENEFKNQKEYSDALLKLSRLPKDNGEIAIWDANQGLRVFGWTHAYNIPYLLYWLDK